MTAPDGRPRVTSAVPGGVVERLTTDPRKAELYRHDPYLREGLYLLTAADGVDLLERVTFTVLKPDAVAGRRCRAVRDALLDLGLVPVGAATVRFDPVLVRELWRYQFNAASRERIAVVDHLLASGPSLLVLWAGRADCSRTVTGSTDAAAPDLPVSVRLTLAKGPADPGASSAHDLRSRVGRVSGLLNFVHTPDEPADVVRELRLLTYRSGTRWLDAALLRAREGAAVDLEPAIGALEGTVPAHDLDAAAAVRRLAQRDDDWGRLARDHPDSLQRGHWLAALAAVPLPAGPAARWDVLAVVATWIECNEPGVEPLLATPRRESPAQTVGAARQEVTVP